MSLKARPQKVLSTCAVFAGMGFRRECSTLGSQCLLMLHLHFFVFAQVLDEARHTSSCLLICGVIVRPCYIEGMGVHQQPLPNTAGITTRTHLFFRVLQQC